MSRHRVSVWIAIAVLVLGLPGTAYPYSHLGLDTTTGSRPIRWTVPSVRWYANDRTVLGVSASQFQSEIAQAFTTWEGRADRFHRVRVRVASLPRSRLMTTACPSSASIANRRWIGCWAPRRFIVDVVTGAIVESDVFFNAIFAWSVTPTGDAVPFRSAVGGDPRNRALPRTRSFGDRRNRTET